MDNFIHRLTKFIKNSNIFVLVYSAVVIPVILIIVWAFIGEKIYNGAIPDGFTYWVLASCSFFSSLGGLVQIIRKESPGILGIPFRGILPVLMGILWVIITWSIGLGLFWSVMQSR
jgi:hypothetical protein